MDQQSQVKNTVFWATGQAKWIIFMLIHEAALPFHTYRPYLFTFVKISNQ